jgi:drug/metabolite transporter (DMT)-like permease
MIAGILCGLGAALSQSFSYLFTRHFVHSRGSGASRDLFILGHLWMGLFGIFGLLLLWPAHARTLLGWPILLPLLGTSLFYLSGQIGLTYALRYAEASTVTPLLGIKVFFQTLLSLSLGTPSGIGGDRTLTAFQWLAVGLCCVGGISLNYAGGRIPRRALAGIACTLMTFTFSDYFIGCLVAALIRELGLSTGAAAILGASLQYLTSGLIVLPFIRTVHHRSARAWRDAAPFALTWFGAMLFLFAAIGALGVILGTILQSTRGIMTILIASAVARLGHEHIEPLHDRGIVLRRVAAGTLMFVAVTLYVIKDPRHIKMSGGGDDWRGVPWSRKNTILC